MKSVANPRKSPRKTPHVTIVLDESARPTFIGTVIGQVWVNESVMILFFALAAGSILYVVMELLNVGRALASKQVVTWGILFGLFLGFATDFILVAAGA